MYSLLRRRADSVAFSALIGFRPAAPLAWWFTSKTTSVEAEGSSLCVEFLILEITATVQSA